MMSIDKLRILSLNPHFSGKIIQNFIQGYGKPADLKLIFYVLPIVLYKDSRNKLCSANSRSSMESLFQSKMDFGGTDTLKLSGKVCLAGFVERFNLLKKETKHALIILSNAGKINLDGYVSLKTEDKYSNYSGNMKTTLKAAYYLGVVFSKSSKEHLNFFLGVKGQ